MHVVMYRPQSDMQRSSKGTFPVHQALHPLSVAADGDADTAGMMIGAGSFGRVYKGHWAGKDVAVKVIEHEPAAAVENEVRAGWSGGSTVTDVDLCTLHAHNTEIQPQRIASSAIFL
jgi:hypothetical protein